MLVRQAYRYELKPNNVQRTMLARHAGTARFAWNWALARRIELSGTKAGPERFSDAVKDHKAWNAWKKENAPTGLRGLQVCPPGSVQGSRPCVRQLPARAGGRPHRGLPEVQEEGRS